MDQAGSLDGDFDVDGKLPINTSNIDETARAVLIQPDNKILIGGSILLSTIVIVLWIYHFMVMAKYHIRE